MSPQVQGMLLLLLVVGTLAVAYGVTTGKAWAFWPLLAVALMAGGAAALRVAYIIGSLLLGRQP